MEQLYLREGNYLKAGECLQTLQHLMKDVIPSENPFRVSCINYIKQGSRNHVYSEIAVESAELTSVLKLSDRFSILADDYRFHTDTDIEDQLDTGLNKGGYAFNLDDLLNKPSIDDQTELPTRIRYAMYCQRLGGDPLRLSNLHKMVDKVKVHNILKRDIEEKRSFWSSYKDPKQIELRLSKTIF